MPHSRSSPSAGRIHMILSSPDVLLVTGDEEHHVFYGRDPNAFPIPEELGWNPFVEALYVHRGEVLANADDSMNDHGAVMLHIHPSSPIACNPTLFPRTWHSATLTVVGESMNLVVDASLGEPVLPWMMRETNVSSWLTELR